MSYAAEVFNLQIDLPEKREKNEIKYNMNCLKNAVIIKICTYVIYKKRMILQIVVNARDLIWNDCNT